MFVVGFSIRDASAPVHLPHNEVAPYEARVASYGAKMRGQIVPIRVDPRMHSWKEDLSGISAVHDFKDS